MSTNPEFIKQMALSKAAARVVTKVICTQSLNEVDTEIDTDLDELARIVAQGLDVNRRYNAFDVVLVRNLPCLKVLAPHMSMKVLSMSLKSNLGHYENLKYLVTLASRSTWAMTKAMNSCIQEGYYNRRAFDLFVENEAYVSRRSFLNCLEMKDTCIREEIFEILCGMKCLNEERCVSVVVDSGHVWAARLMSDYGYDFQNNNYDFRDGGYHLFATAISNRDIAMIEFLCEVDSEFETEAFREFLEINDDEIDNETGCSISGLILQLLHQYKIKIKKCRLPSFKPNIQAYAYDNNLVQ